MYNKGLNKTSEFDMYLAKRQGASWLRI